MFEGGLSFPELGGLSFLGLSFPELGGLSFLGLSFPELGGLSFLVKLGDSCHETKRTGNIVVFFPVILQLVVK